MLLPVNIYYLSRHKCEIMNIMDLITESLKSMHLKEEILLSMKRCGKTLEGRVEVKECASAAFYCMAL